MLSLIVTDIAKKEGFSIERSAAELVALLAEGSFRDALSILQKILAVSNGKNIAIAEVEDVSGAPRGELVRQLMSALVRKDAGAALKVAEAAVSQNIDARILMKLLLLRMRIILLMRYAPDLAEELSQELTEADVSIAKELSKEPTVNSDMLRSLLEAYSRMAYAAVPHLPLELAIVDICSDGARAQQS